MDTTSTGIHIPDADPRGSGPGLIPQLRLTIQEIDAYISTIPASVVLDTSYASLSAAVSAIGATPTILRIRTALWPAGASCTVPDTLRLSFTDLGTLAIATGQTVVILSSDDLFPTRRIFVQSGTGKADLTTNKTLRYINPIWWSTGTGTSADPYIGWDGIFAANCRYRFSAGWFSFSTSLDWKWTCLEIRGAGVTTTFLKYTGTGTYAISGIGPVVPIAYAQNIGGFSLLGTASAHNGYVIDGTTYSHYDFIHIQDFPEICFMTGLYITDYFKHIITASANVYPQTVTPTKGQIYGWDDLGHNTTNSVMEDLIAEGCSVRGMQIDTVLDCSFIGGTSEYNGVGAIGLFLGSQAQNNRFSAMDLEGNSGDDLRLTGSCKNNTFENMLVVGATHITGGIHNRFIQGSYDAFTLDSGTVTIIDGIQYGVSGGAFTDNSTETWYLAPIRQADTMTTAMPLRGNAFKYGIGTVAQDTTYAGSPEGHVTAIIGSTCRDTVNGDFYRKPSGTGNTGWVLSNGSASGVGAFKVDRNGTGQTGLTTGSYNKVQFTNVLEDDANWFDETTNYRYTPQVAGWYFFNASCSDNSVSAGESPILAVYKNGSASVKGNYLNSSAGLTLAFYMAQVSGMIYLNGSTDYVEVFIYKPTGTTIGGAVEQTYFNGFLVRAD